MIINSVLPPTSFQSVISGKWYIVTTDPKLGWVEVNRKYGWEELEKMFSVDSMGTMKLLYQVFSLNSLQNAIFRDGLRLMPTLKH